VVLRELGLRSRRSNADLPGSPDFANRGAKWALFVHGCYWHHHTGCSRATIPKNNKGFWRAKFADNKRRDARTARVLRAAGFRVVTVWECQTRHPLKLIRRIAKLQRGNE
jgi:DNA mismatch endonuclease (patch repair protein)